MLCANILVFSVSPVCQNFNYTVSHSRRANGKENPQSRYEEGMLRTPKNLQPPDPPALLAGYHVMATGPIARRSRWCGGLLLCPSLLCQETVQTGHLFPSEKGRDQKGCVLFRVIPGNVISKKTAERFIAALRRMTQSGEPEQTRRQGQDA